MRVLWFTNAPLPAVTGTGMRGGGWMENLREAMQGLPNAPSLGIVSPTSTLITDCVIDSVNYYNYFNPPKNRLQKIANQLFAKQDDGKVIEYALEVVQQYKPDIIQVFGTERAWGLIAEPAKIPVVISLQGILTVYERFRNEDITLGENISLFRFPDLLMGKNLFSENLRWKKGIDREQRIFKGNRYFLGRTFWDHSVSNLLNPEAKYFHGDEILGDIYYQTQWSLDSAQPFTIFSTLKNSALKGSLVLLEAIYLLKDTYPQLQARIAGIMPETSFGELVQKRLRKSGLEKSIHLLGKIPASQIAIELKKCSVFVHSSHMDNSPNGLCEAMLVGVPCIASSVGGIPSLLHDNVEGFLYNHSDPYDLAGKINILFKDTKCAIRMGESAHKVAQARHDPTKIAAQILKIYSTILERA